MSTDISLLDDKSGAYFFYFQFENNYDGFFVDLCSRFGEVRSIGIANIYNRWSHLTVTGNSPFAFYFDSVQKSISVRFLISEYFWNFLLQTRPLILFRERAWLSLQIIRDI